MFLAVSTPRLWTQCDYSPRLLPSFSLAGSPSGQVENNPPSILGRAAGKLSVSNAHALITETQPFIFFSPLSLLCLISELVKWAGALSVVFFFFFIWKRVVRQKQTGFWLQMDDLPCKEFKSFNFRGEWGRNAVCTRKLTGRRRGGGRRHLLPICLVLSEIAVSQNYLCSRII